MVTPATGKKFLFRKAPRSPIKYFDYLSKDGNANLRQACTVSGLTLSLPFGFRTVMTRSFA